MNDHYYSRYAVDLRRELSAALPHDVLKRLHEKVAWRLALRMVHFEPGAAHGLARR